MSFASTSVLVEFPHHLPVVRFPFAFELPTASTMGAERASALVNMVAEGWAARSEDASAGVHSLSLDSSPESREG